MSPHQRLKTKLTLFAIALILLGPALDNRGHSYSPGTLAQTSSTDSPSVSVSSPQDRYRISAEKKLAAGEQSLKEWTRESSRAAIDKFKSSLVDWQAVRDRHAEAQTLRRIGDVYQALGEYQNALTFYNHARSVIRKIRDRGKEGEVLNDVCYVYNNLGESQKALSLCTRALKLSRAFANQREEARALNNLGEIYYGLGKLQRSLDFYKQALSLWRSPGNRPGLALTLLNFGYTYSDLGQMGEALDSYNQALALCQLTTDRRGQAVTLSAIGRLYSRMGETQKAIDSFERAMQLIRIIGDPIEEARVLNGMAYIYNGLGQKQRALEFYDRALSLFRAANYPNGEAATLGDAGRVYFSLGDNERALEYLQRSLSIFKTVGDHRMEIANLKEIGRIHNARGDKRLAFQSYNIARSFYHGQKDRRGEAATLNLIGSIYQDWGQTQKALESYSRALLLSREAEYPVAEAMTLYNIGNVERERGSLEQARTRSEAALKIVESLRTNVTSQDLRASFFATVRQHYELYVDILMQLHKQQPTKGFDATAFDVSERARARSLLESLKESGADIRQGVDTALLERERSLEQALNAKAERRMQLIAARNDVEAQTIGREIDQLTREYDETKTQIKLTSPHYAALVQPEPLKLHQIQAQLLDDNSLLLEYMLGDERSYVWAVTRTEVSSFELPGRVAIEQTAGRLHSLLTARLPRQDETTDQRQRRVVESDSQLPNETESLSRLLLGPVTEKIDKKRVLIVPDGALQYIPFQVLTVSTDTRSHGPSEVKANDKGDNRIPLIIDHEIINEPSASTLALVLSEKANRKPASNTVAILADPVFEADDPRVKVPNKDTTSAPASSVPSKIAEALRDVSLDGLKIPRLLASREEAEGIMAVIPQGTGLKALGFDASRSTVARKDLDQYRIVHFATHGVLDNENPELSGIVLSLFDQEGRPQDGFLRLHDIYNLNLPVDLVVLSACNTGLGKDVKGEGLIGLTRGFMYAGAAGVVASLWKVDDDATAELMRHFYEALFKKGMSPSEALRESQLAMRQQPRWHAPYYWAGFVLQGQYDQKESMTGPSLRIRGRLAELIIITGILTGAAFLVLRRRRKGAK
ncbi:MAG TPA: CHAT domain-containing protein [Pyrinomonadaceae bacterium]|jgi:Uncharacterized protein conserved in bacteria|nr:CHAT domain-containing protein [Pyrinomonadaceae bacterium]